MTIPPFTHHAGRQQGVAAALALALALGCKGDRPEDAETPPPSPPPAADPASPAGAPAAVKADMADHFARIVVMRDAVVAGNIADTREPARWLAEHGAPAGVPESWQPHVGDLRDAARAVTEATTVEQVAERFATLSGVCGRCHAAHKVRIPYVVGSPPDPAGDSDRMELHKWAADRLWKGLVLPHDGAWNLGASSIASWQLRPSVESDDPAVSRRVQTLAQRVRELATSGRDSTGSDRARVYGELLVICGRCHALTRR